MPVVISDSLMIPLMHSSLVFIAFVFSVKWFAHTHFNGLTAIASAISTVKWFLLFMYGSVMSSGVRSPDKRLKAGGIAAKVSMVGYRCSLFGAP